MRSSLEGCLSYTQTQLYDFLCKIDKDYPVPLSHKVDLADYAQKLYEKAHIKAVIEGDTILSLVAGYTENLESDLAFITLVGTLPEARGKGLAPTLLSAFIEDCRKRGIGGVHLYTAKGNASAVSVYRKLGFVAYSPEKEPRPNDLHFVYWIKE